ncbi:hypothetical protein EVAR_78745_1 [Eumeta japonica]|uniref:Uncharacterized protein n=1 Tax=Eumeta variegata TaxID=151549 RepID=A0A4C1T217_EUMVA|nr:hypothetical protein EVAR_78745_1 [Eumeta japonica]
MSTVICCRLFGQGMFPSSSSARSVVPVRARESKINTPPNSPICLHNVVLNRVNGGLQSSDTCSDDLESLKISIEQKGSKCKAEHVNCTPSQTL